MKEEWPKVIFASCGRLIELMPMSTDTKLAFMRWGYCSGQRSDYVGILHIPVSVKMYDLW